MAVDLTISNRTSKIWFESTSRCNLRCVYCHMSHLDMPEHDIDFNGFDNLVQSMKERQVGEFIFNGRGENSFLSGWHKQISKVIESGIPVSTVTNLSLSYSEEELETFSRFESITVSVDTTDYETFRNIRRKASIHQVISNIIKIRGIALRQGGKIPEIAWNMIMHTHSFQRVDQSVSDGLAAGVSRFQISVLGETEELAGALNPRQLDRLSREEFVEGCGKLFQAVGMIKKAGKAVNVSPGLLLLLNNVKRNYQIVEVDFSSLPIG